MDTPNLLEELALSLRSVVDPENNEHFGIEMVLNSYTVFMFKEQATALSEEPAKAVDFLETNNRTLQ